ncbi:MAG: ABC transporter permease [Muribaculaceae bacterium]|nr:ABC transporter permease [Muribaculaceae bacterium]MDE6643967.1 ABC transporter permease [Muribaculaceae bacterium]
MSNNIWLVIRREYIERVSKKSFILTTILTPLLIVLISVIPVLLATFQSSDTQIYAVLDRSEVIASELTDGESVKFVSVNMPLDSLKADDAFAGVLVIGSRIMDNPSDVQLYTHGAGSMETETYISKQIKSIIESKRLEAYNIANLDQILNNIKANVILSTYRLDAEDESSTSTIMCFVLGIAMAFLLYMFLLIYGQMVMTSIIEEKNNRVLEIIVSSVKPEHLMLGKILGIGLVAVTQIVLWMAILSTLVGVIMPMIIPSDVATQMAALNAGNLDAASATVDIDLLQTMSMLGNIGFMISLFFYLTIFLIGGFLLYASIFAAIGSAVDNIQDASQLSYIPTIPIIAAIVCATTIGNDPNSSLAMWLSMFPFTSPMIMVVRIPFGIPTWEIWVSIVLLFATFFLMVWLAAKIYRVGIFMYGKKPSVKELIRWARYK